ncbi:MAG: hypothetical protein KDK70_41265, partial [Myxococcales bacterium]|nr:hypothetical protein [Myxococcales bacterium]
ARVLGDPQRPAADAPWDRFVALAQRLVERDEALVLTCDAEAAARRAEALVTATSATEALVQASSLRPGAVVCEISRPHDLGPEVKAARPDVRVIDGGIIELPGRPDIGSFGPPPGHGYACMVETMALALEQRYEHASLGGQLEPGEVDRLRALVARHGFRVVVPPHGDGPSN